jgi:protein-disulfide isomerase
VATKPKKYDLNAADRRRNLFIQIGLTAIVVLVAVGLFFYITNSGSAKPKAGEVKSIRVAAANVATKEGSSDPKAVVSLYEDFLCPHCGAFEQEFGPTIKKLVDSGAIAADYYMVAILDKQGNGYSSRASNAAYCVADEDKTPNKEVFSRFHAALYAQQPSETGTSFPDNKALIETARQAGAGGSVPDCINSGRYLPLAQGLAGATNVNGTPTIRINGDDFPISGPNGPAKPQDLVDKVKAIVGDVPGLTTAPPASLPPSPGAPGAALPSAPAAPGNP